MSPLPARRRPDERGSALLLAVIIVLVLGLVGLAAARRASLGSESAVAKRQYDRSVSCADAARELLMGQFRAYGTHPTSLVLDETVDGQALNTGHYGNVAVTSVVPAPGASTHAAFGASDIANRISRTGMGGQTYRMTVVCSGGVVDGGTPARQREVEFLVRFGI